MSSICKFARIFVFLVSLLLIAMSPLMAQRTRLSEEELATAELEELLSEYLDDDATHYQLAELLSRQDERESALGHFEKALELNPDAPIYGNEYRLTCVWWHEFDRCIDFLENLVEQNDASINARYHLALAYVDKMPWYMLGMVQQGQQSNLSMEHLTKIIEQDSIFWGAWYGRGMNHLHWPRMMRHAPDAIADFKQALKLQNELNLSPPKPYFELTYLGLGDAYVKDRDHAEARAVWREGLALFPHSAKLRRRLSIADDEELEAFVKKTRSLKKPINTDMWMIWAK